jgi:hypothetical protein
VTGNEHKGAAERLRETVNLKVTGKYACQVHPDDVRSVLEALATKDAELSALRDERDDAVSTLTAWFDMAAKIEAEAVPVIMGGLRGYIRTARNGGMPDEYAAPALAVLEDYCKLQMGRDLVPVLRGMAAALTHQEKDAQDD